MNPQYPLILKFLIQPVKENSMQFSSVDSQKEWLSHCVPKPMSKPVRYNLSRSHAHESSLTWDDAAIAFAMACFLRCCCWWTSLLWASLCFNSSFKLLTFSFKSLFSIFLSKTWHLKSIWCYIYECYNGSCASPKHKGWTVYNLASTTILNMYCSNVFASCILCRCCKKPGPEKLWRSCTSESSEAIATKAFEEVSSILFSKVDLSLLTASDDGGLHFNINDGNNAEFWVILKLAEVYSR